MSTVPNISLPECYEHINIVSPREVRWIKRPSPAPLFSGSTRHATAALRDGLRRVTGEDVRWSAARRASDDCATGNGQHSVGLAGQRWVAETCHDRQTVAGGQIAEEPEERRRLVPGELRIRLGDDQTFGLGAWPDGKPYTIVDDMPRGRAAHRMRPREVDDVNPPTDSGRRVRRERRAIDPCPSLGGHDATADDLEQRQPLVAPLREHRDERALLEPQAQAAQPPHTSFPDTDAEQLDHAADP